MAKRSILMDMDGVQLTRDDLNTTYYRSTVAWTSTNYRKMKGSKVSFTPGLQVPVCDRRYDQFFFLLEVTWVPIEGSLREIRWRVVLYIPPFLPSELTKSGVWKTKYLIKRGFIPEWDVVFGDK